MFPVTRPPLTQRIAARIQTGRREISFYDGRQVCADTDLHERAMQILRGVVPVGARVADVGCGQGAFSRRLADAGYAVVGLDIEPLRDAAGFQFQQLDLLNPVARAAFVEEHGGSFDAVALIEVIEHVRNPWETLEFCAGLLRPGGALLLSTPNVTSAFARFRFLTGGRLHQFERADFSYGHINPMTSLMVEKVLQDSGFDLEVKRPGPPLPILVWNREIPSLSARAIDAAGWLIANALAPLMRGGDRRGWSLFFVARRH